MSKSNDLAVMTIRIDVAKLRNEISELKTELKKLKELINEQLGIEITSID